MSKTEKWLHANMPKAVISKMALEVPFEHIELLKLGAFRFNDGTTQGWKIDQLYDTYDKTMTEIQPYTDPSTNKFYGFSLSNQQNIALAAGAYPCILLGSTATSVDFYLESPDLASNQDWKNIKGYSLDLQRNFFSLCFDQMPDKPPYHYFVQLQVCMWDTQEKKWRIYSEADEESNEYVFHAVALCTPCRFIWTADVFTNPDMELRFLRIRFTQPNLIGSGAGECLPKGAWLIGNVSPET